MSELVRRTEATEKTLRKYRHRPFDWKSQATCIHLARTQLRNMGHKPPGIPRFMSAVGAARALKQAGFDNLEGLLDALPVTRIPYSMMLVGDLALMAGEPPFDAIVVCAGGKMLGWGEGDDGGIKPIEAYEIKAAWRL